MHIIVGGPNSLRHMYMLDVHITRQCNDVDRVLQVVYVRCLTQLLSLHQHCHRHFFASCLASLFSK